MRNGWEQQSQPTEISLEVGLDLIFQFLTRSQQGNPSVPFMFYLLLTISTTLIQLWNKQCWHTVDALKIWTLWAKSIVRNEIWDCTSCSWHWRAQSEWKPEKNSVSVVLFWACTKQLLLCVYQDTVQAFDPYSKGGLGEGTGYVLFLDTLALHGFPGSS